MSEEKADNAQAEKSPVVTPKEAPQESKQPETLTGVRHVDFAESLTKNAGDQGISLNPVGSHATNPFVPQNIVQLQPPSQIVTPTPPSHEAVTTPPQDQSSGSDSDTEK